MIRIKIFNPVEGEIVFENVTITKVSENGHFDWVGVDGSGMAMCNPVIVKIIADDGSELTPQVAYEYGSQKSEIQILTTEIQALKQKNEGFEALLAQTNADFSGFMDFYFTVNPE